MPIRHLTGILGASLLAGLLAGSSHYNLPQSRGAEVGVLTCETVPGTQSSVLLASRVEMDCRFRGTASPRRLGRAWRAGSEPRLRESLGP